MSYCCKCEGVIFPRLKNVFCEKHEAEYQEWLNQDYVPEEKCECGGEGWFNGTVDLTTEGDPMPVERCCLCFSIRMMIAKNGTQRLYVRKDV